MSDEKRIGMPEFTGRLYGNPVFRDGDKVYVVDVSKMMLSREEMQRAMTERMERSLLASDDYRCPFDFMDDFDRWFEWRERLYFRKQTTGQAITAMLDDLDEIRKHKIDRPFRFKMGLDYGYGGVLSRTAFFKGVSA